MMPTNQHPGSTRGPLAPHEVRALAIRCREQGDSAVAAAIGLDRLTIARAACGLSIMRGSREIIARHLAATEATQ